MSGKTEIVKADITGLDTDALNVLTNNQNSLMIKTCDSWITISGNEGYGEKY